MKNTRCPLCNSDDSKIVCDKTELKRIGVREITNVICLRCGLIYNNPVPSSEILNNYYKKDFVRDKSGVKDDFNRYIEVLKIKNLDEKEKRVVDFLKPFLNKDSNVLDIGCAHGALLSGIKKELGCKVYGLEPDSLMVKVAREHYRLDNIKEDFIENYFEEEKQKFNMIILRNVLEHLRNTNNILAGLKNLMEDNGYLFLVFPNAANFVPERNIYRCLEFGHLYTFTPFSIQQLLLKHGMKVVKWSYDHFHLLQVVATKIENPVNMVSFEDMRAGLSISKIERNIKQHKYIHFFFRLKRKIKTILKLKWRE